MKLFLTGCVETGMLLDRRKITTVFWVLFLTSCGQEQNRTTAPEADKPDWQTFTATAYSVDGETASGAVTREGRTVAADPSVLPAGTRIEVADAGTYSGIYVVQDTGPKIKGREIDLFIDNPAEAKLFGKKQVRVRILNAPAQTAPK